MLIEWRYNLEWCVQITLMIHCWYNSDWANLPVRHLPICSPSNNFLFHLAKGWVLLFSSSDIRNVENIDNGHRKTEHLIDIVNLTSHQILILKVVDFLVFGYFTSNFLFQIFLSSSFLWLCIITSRRPPLSVGVRPILVFTHFAIPWPSTLPYYGTCKDWCHNIPKPKCTMSLFTGQTRTKLHFPSSLLYLTYIIQW